MTDVSFEGTGLRDERRAAVEEAVGYCPGELFPQGLLVQIGNEFWPAASPRTSIATINWEGEQGASRPILKLKGSGFYWKPIVQKFGPAGRILSVMPVGVCMHELLGHVGQTMDPTIDGIWSLEEKRRWAYAQNPGGWQHEGGPSIIGLAYGGKFAELEAAIQEKLIGLTTERELQRPADWGVTPDDPVEHQPDPEPVAPPAEPSGASVWVPQALREVVERVTRGRAAVTLSDLERAGWGGETFLAAPALVREAIALAFHDLPEEWDNAARVAQLESGWEARAHVVDRFITSGGLNFRPRPSDDADIPEGWRVVREDSRGLFQINTTPAAHAWALATGDLFDPLVNARAARRIFDASRQARGNGWHPWTTARMHEIESVA